MATSSEELKQRMLRGLKEEIPLIKVTRLYLVSGNLIQVFGFSTFCINAIFKPRAAVGESLEPLCWMISVLINNYQMRLNMI